MKLRAKVSGWVLRGLVGAVAFAGSNVWGTITPTGDVEPTNPSTWTSSTTGKIGNTSNGMLMVNGGSGLVSSSGYLGSNGGVTGIVTVDGAGSTWIIGNLLEVGTYGNGTLNITNGGLVSNIGSEVGTYGGSVGSVTVDGSGSMWTNTSYLEIGGESVSTLSITNGGKVISGSITERSNLGYSSGSSGTVTVDGAGSTWTVGGELDVGFYNGAGRLNITDGGVVTATSTYAGSWGHAAPINFGTSSGTLTTQTLYALPSQVVGTGTINTRGLISDINLVFDATHGLSQTLTWNSAGQNITINLDLTGASGTIGNLGAGYKNTGTLTIQDGVAVTSANGYLGYPNGATGTATVSGAGSSWGNSNLYVGDGYANDPLSGPGGTGALNICNGGTVSTSNYGYIGYGIGAKGTVNVDSPGSTWSNSYLYVGFTDYLGSSSTGTLNISNGGNVNSSSGGIIGYNEDLLYDNGPTGIVFVDGVGSKWTINGGFYVGLFATGVLHITNGGMISSNYGSYIGANSSSTSAPVGTVSVDDPGSTWNNSSLAVGTGNGTGTLCIGNGGTVTATSVSIDSSSLLTIDVGNGSALGVGTGSLTNSGTIRLTAKANVATGIYTPITASTGSSWGTIQTVGGTWNSSTHQFTVSPVATGTAGNAVTIDRSQTQRILITDPISGDTVGVSFMPTTSSSNLTLTASTLTGAQLSLLQTALGGSSLALAGWTFTTSGYTAGNPVYLSMGIGAGYSTDSLAVWHYDGTNWTAYSAPDLNYDGADANFTVTGFSGYAVAAGPLESGSGVWKNGAGDNLWTTNNWGNSNWSSAVPYSAGSIATFDDTVLSASRTVTLNGPKVVGGIVLNTTAGGYTIGTNGDSLTLNNGAGMASIAVTGSNNHTIVAPVITASNAGITVSGSASLNISGGITNNNTLTLSNGSSGTLNAGVIAGTGNTVVSSGTVSASGIIQNNLAVNGILHITATGTPNTGGSTSVVTSLTIAGSSGAWTGRLDLGDNSLVISGGGSGVLGVVANQIHEGLFGDGNGITSSTALANGSTTLGYALASSIQSGSFNFEGQTVSGNDVLVKYTWKGDANLDGEVNVADLGILATNFGHTSGVSWVQGDFNGDGIVNVADLGTLATYFGDGATLGSPLLSFQDAMALFPQFGGGGGTGSVPEPASLTLLTLGAAVLLRRRGK